jgi:hypothetical protein
MALKLLIAAGEAANSVSELPPSVQALIDQADSIVVITPTLPSRFEWLVSATDKATEQADERLRTVLDQLGEREAEAAGVTVSDEPLASIEDAIREFAPDHLLIALRNGGHADWQERGLLEKINERIQIPLTIFEIPASAAI